MRLVDVVVVALRVLALPVLDERERRVEQRAVFAVLGLRVRHGRVEVVVGPVASSAAAVAWVRAAGRVVVAAAAGGVVVFVAVGGAGGGGVTAAGVFVDGVFDEVGEGHFGWMCGYEYGWIRYEVGKRME